MPKPMPTGPRRNYRARLGGMCSEEELTTFFFFLTRGNQFGSVGFETGCRSKSYEKE